MEGLFALYYIGEDLCNYLCGFMAMPSDIGNA